VEVKALAHTQGSETSTWFLEGSERRGYIRGGVTAWHAERESGNSDELAEICERHLSIRRHEGLINPIGSARLNRGP